jgi:hypothetical protein
MPRQYTPGPLPFLPFTLVEVTCEQCAQRFLARRSERRPRRFCSRPCAWAAQRRQVSLSCTVCGQAFEVEPSVAKLRKTCSRACQQAALRKPAYQRVCEQCGTAFEARRHQAKLGYARFCSKACFGRSIRTEIERVCGTCETPFAAVPSAVAQGAARFCSVACADAAKVVPLLDRIWRHIDVRGAAECWPWTAKRHARGYGETADRGKHLRVTRVLLEARLGRPLRHGELALHACSNPPCCNPSHLFVGDHRANMAQRKAEGKYPTGPTAPMSRESRAARRAHGDVPRKMLERAAPIPSEGSSSRR